MTDYKIGKGTQELARNFEKTSVRVALDLNHSSGWFVSDREAGDIVLDWYVQAQDEMFSEEEGISIYKGAALVREGKVHFYDRYPMGGGPFKVSDFKSPEFRKRAELISENIERLLKE